MDVKHTKCILSICNAPSSDVIKMFSGPLSAPTHTYGSVSHYHAQPCTGLSLRCHVCNTKSGSTTLIHLDPKNYELVWVNIKL